MGMEQGRGEIPSYKAVITEEARKERQKEGDRTNEGETSAAGAQRRMRVTSKFLLRATNKPRFVIPPNRLEKYRSYMRDYALICKFIGYWPAEKDLLRWI